MKYGVGLGEEGEKAKIIGKGTFEVLRFICQISDRHVPLYIFDLATYGLRTEASEGSLLDIISVSCRLTWNKKKYLQTWYAKTVSERPLPCHRFG